MEFVILNGKGLPSISPTIRSFQYALRDAAPKVGIVRTGIGVIPANFLPGGISKSVNPSLLGYSLLCLCCKRSPVVQKDVPITHAGFVDCNPRIRLRSWSLICRIKVHRVINCSSSVGNRSRPQSTYSACHQHALVQLPCVTLEKLSACLIHIPSSHHAV